MKLQISFIAFSMLVFIASCKKDEDEVTNPPIVNEEEVITTLTLQFTETSGAEDPFTVTFRDPDGDGGLAPDIFESITLTGGLSYTCSILLLNETETPADTISLEVLAEADEHLFCFEVTGADLDIARTDSDGEFEVGLESLWTAGALSSGTVMVTLKHQPGIKDGTCEVGDTDVEVEFDVVIE